MIAEIEYKDGVSGFIHDVMEVKSNSQMRSYQFVGSDCTHVINFDEVRAIMLTDDDPEL